MIKNDIRILYIRRAKGKVKDGSGDFQISNVFLLSSNLITIEIFDNFLKFVGHCNNPSDFRVTFIVLFFFDFNRARNEKKISFTSVELSFQEKIF